MSLSDVILSYGGIEVTPYEAYKDIFKLGEGLIQKKNEPSGSYKANPIAYYKNSKHKNGVYRVMFEDEFENILNNELCNADFAIMNGITYFGRKNLGENASKMYAMIFDLDDVTDSSLNNFFHAAKTIDFYPIPNYMVLSGHGLHLYYVFEEPISLYPNIKVQLKELKYELTERIWNQYTSTNKKKQRQGIFQPFRVIGSKTKEDAPVKKVEVYKCNTHPFDVVQLGEYTADKTRVDLKQIFKESMWSLEEARQKWPDWYHDKIDSKLPKKTWTCKPALYDWWIKQVYAGAAAGHRYFCVMALAIYAAKCGVSYEKLRDDAYKMLPFLDSLSNDDPFTAEDVESALECYDERYKTFPRDDISKLTDIPIQKNKRNGLNQNQHLYLARRRKEDMKAINLPMKSPEGRPDKQEIVQKWKKEHPDDSKYQCIKDTGLSKNTVYKWWNENA